MWQIKRATSARGAVLLLLTAVALVSKPYIGELKLPQYQPSTDLTEATTDPTSEELFEPKKTDSAKMLAAIESPLPRREQKEPPARHNTQFLGGTQIASVTSYKPISDPLAPETIQTLIDKYATEYGANPSLMTIIAKCESGFRSDAISPSGSFHGMYQFVPSTWQSNRRAMGLSEDLSLMYNAEEAIKTAAFKMGRDGYGAWPACHSYARQQLSLAS